MAAVQCYIPRASAEAAQIDQVDAKARAQGIRGASLEASYYRARGQCRVTCQRPVAEFLAGELRSTIQAATTIELRSKCETALAALLEAIADTDRPAPKAGPMKMGDSEPDRLWNYPRER